MPSVFFSYSHADEALRDQLEKQLALLKRQGAIETWHDRSTISSTLHCPVASGLPPCRENMTAGFLRWQIVIGNGDEKRILKTIDGTTSSTSKKTTNA
jgi:hypothetical protein